MSNPKRGALVTYRKCNMANRLLLLYEKVILRRRALVEMVFDQLKHLFQIEYNPALESDQLHDQSCGQTRCLLPATDQVVNLPQRAIKIDRHYPQLTLSNH